MRRFLTTWLRHLWPKRFLIQVVLLGTLMLVVGIAATSLYTVNQVLQQQHRDTQERLAAVGSNLAFASAHFLLVRDQGALEHLLLQTANYPGLRSIAIVNQHRRVISEVRHEAGKAPEAVFNYGMLTPPPGNTAQHVWHYGVARQGAIFAMGLDATSLVVWQPVEKGQLGWLRIETAVDESRADALRLVRDHAIFALIAVVLSALALYLLLCPNLFALAAATHFARALTQARGQQNTVFSGSTELEQLGHALNETSHRLHVQEEALTETSALLASVLDAASEVSIIATNHEGVVTLFNRGAERLLGYTADEIVGKQTPALFHLPAEVAARGLELSLAQGYAVEGFRVFVEMPEQQGAEQREWTYIRKSGEHVPVSLVVTAIRTAGEISGYLGIAQDITERKRVESMKSEFVSTVSHELRTPLTSISGALGLIIGGALGEIPAQAQQMIAIAHKNSQRLTFLINDLLDMEKLVAGKMHFDLQAQALMPLLEQSIDANRAFGAARRVTLALTGAASEAEVRVDSQRLMQVMSNLLSNAIKYSPEDSAVEVAVKLDADRVCVTVSDCGPGIPAAFRERIFQKFSQADSSDTRQKGGTGLGLAISRELVERMDGQIGFESAEGEGARFYFDLPLWRAQGSSPFIEANHKSAAPRILVVEDEPDIAQLLSQMLTRAGYVVDIARNGTEALHALQQSRYAAVTLDLMLPDIIGLDLMRKIRQRPETAHLPILVVSAKMEEGRLAINGDFSSIEWLAKPIDEPRLLSVLDSYISGTDGQRPRVLHVEDDADLHQVIRATVSGRFDFVLATSLREARAYLTQMHFDLVLVDIGLPDGCGWDLLPEIRAQQADARVVILSGTDISPDDARKVEAVLLKSHVSPQQLLDALKSRICLSPS